MLVSRRARRPPPGVQTEYCCDEVQAVLLVFLRPEDRPPPERVELPRLLDALPVLAFELPVWRERLPADRLVRVDAAERVDVLLRARVAGARFRLRDAEDFLPVPANWVTVSQMR